jgi:hypothetical protein
VSMAHFADNERAPDQRVELVRGLIGTPSGTRTPNPLRTLRSSERRRVVAANGALTWAFVDLRRLPSLIARAPSAGLSGHFVGSFEDRTGGGHRSPLPSARCSCCSPSSKRSIAEGGRAASTCPPSAPSQRAGSDELLPVSSRTTTTSHPPSRTSLARFELLRATSLRPPRRQVPPLAPPGRSLVFGLEGSSKEPKSIRPVTGMPPTKTLLLSSAAAVLR